MASAVNNDVARAASLIAVAVLPAAAGLTGSSYLHPVEFTAGFHKASLIAAGLCVLGGVLAAFTIRNPRRAEAGAAPAPSPSCTAAWTRRPHERRWRWPRPPLASRGRPAREPGLRPRRSSRFSGL